MSKQKMRLDLNATTINDNIGVWAFHAGRNKRFFKTFMDNGMVFLDMPGVRLTSDLVRDEVSLRNKIAMSENISLHYRGKAAEGATLSRTPQDYRTEATKKKYNHMVSSAKRFVEEIKRGDLVLVPPRTQYDPVLFGIIQDNFNPRNTANITPYTDDPINLRRVRWLTTSVSKRDLPGDLAIRLENRNTIVSIDEELKDRALAAAFKNYITLTSSKIDVECPLYRGKNSLETLEVQKLINFFAAIYYMHENGTINEAQNLSLTEIARDYYEEGVIERIENEFHSPGFYRIVTKTCTLGLFIIAGIALASDSSFTPDIAETLNVINSQAGGDDNNADRIRGLIRSTVDSISNETIEEVNQAGQTARENLRVKTNTVLSRE